MLLINFYRQQLELPAGHWRFLFHQRRPARFLNHHVILAPEVETAQV
jgi:hypothetical protein